MLAEKPMSLRSGGKDVVVRVRESRIHQDED